MLFDAFTARSLRLKNRAVMAPLTRSRAVDANTPNALMAQYYGQRASAGLIITEGTSPSPNGLGYPRIPALYNRTHVEGWKLVTSEVHARGGKIFVQLMHSGRVGHAANLPAGGVLMGPTAEPCPGEMYTDSKGLQPNGVPRAMTQADIDHAIAEFTTSARLAMEAGFDGIELHGANGYLIEQFLNPIVNQRTDAYGQGIDGRNRVAIDVARAAADAIGSDRVGIRLSPYGVFNGTGAFPQVEAQYFALARELSALNLLYVHLIDHSSLGAPPVPADFKVRLRQVFSGCFILSGGFDKTLAEAALQANRGDLIAFGRAFLANPDLLERMRRGEALNEPDPATFYTPGARGYTDYPALAAG